jgi:hypothetical protein
MTVTVDGERIIIILQAYFEVFQKRLRMKIQDILLIFELY